MGVKERREREEYGRLEAILVAAESVFTRSGYHEARMDDIAAAAELSKGTIYYYFKSKDEIFARLLARESEKMIAEIRSRIPEPLAFREALEQIVDFFLEYTEANRGFLKMALPSMGRFIRFGDPEIVRRATKSFASFETFVRDTMRIKIRREGLPFKAEDLQAFLKALQFGIGIAILDGRPDKARAAARFFLDLAGRAMKTNAASFPKKKSRPSGKKSVRIPSISVKVTS